MYNSYSFLISASELIWKFPSKILIYPKKKAFHFLLAKIRLVYWTHKKVKVSRYRHADHKEERSYISYSFLTSTLDGVNGQRHAPATL
jgi:hypothetical protein